MKKAHSGTWFSNVHSETQKLRRQNANVLRLRSVRCLVSHVIFQFPNSRHIYALRTYFYLGKRISWFPLSFSPCGVQGELNFLLGFGFIVSLRYFFCIHTLKFLPYLLVLLSFTRYFFVFHAVRPEGIFIQRRYASQLTCTIE